MPISDTYCTTPSRQNVVLTLPLPVFIEISINIMEHGRGRLILRLFLLMFDASSFLPSVENLQNMIEKRLSSVVRLYRL